MKSEFYVINLVKSSEDACRRVAECLGLDGSVRRDHVLYELSRRNVLWRFMTRFECNWHDIFEELRRLLDREIEGLDVLEESDLEVLMEPKGPRVLGELLGCTAGESLQLLFSAEALQQVIRETGVARQRDQLQNDSEWLLSVLLSDTGRLKLEHALGSVDRWALLYDLMVVSVRRNLAEKLGCSEGDALRVLVRRIKQTDRVMKPIGNVAEFGSGTGLDAVALSKFRMYLHIYRYSMIGEAKSQAHRAKARLPGCRVPEMLPSVVKYYVSRDFRSAINDLLDTKETLRSICLTETLGLLERAPNETRIEVTTLPRDGNELAAGVWCVEDQNQKRTEVLRLRQLDPERLKHIQAHLPKRVADLPQTGSTVADRLLSAMLPPVSQWKRSLRAALASKANPETLDDAFIQSLVLAGVSLRPHTPGLDFGRSPDVLPKPEARVEFLVGPKGIADKLQQEYRCRGKDLQPVQIAHRDAPSSGRPPSHG